MKGPGTREQWLHWRYRTKENNLRDATLRELEKILKSEEASVLFI